MAEQTADYEKFMELRAVSAWLRLFMCDVDLSVSKTVVYRLEVLESWWLSICDQFLRPVCCDSPSQFQRQSKVARTEDGLAGRRGVVLQGPGVGPGVFDYSTC